MFQDFNFFQRVHRLNRFGAKYRDQKEGEEFFGCIPTTYGWFTRRLSHAAAVDSCVSAEIGNFLIFHTATFCCSECRKFNSSEWAFMALTDYMQSASKTSIGLQQIRNFSSFFNKKSPIPGLFFSIFDFSIQLTVNILYNFADDWIRIVDLWCRKQPLFQMSHNHCPNYLQRSITCHSSIAVW